MGAAGPAQDAKSWRRDSCIATALSSANNMAVTGSTEKFMVKREVLYFQLVVLLLDLHFEASLSNS